MRRIIGYLLLLSLVVSCTSLPSGENERLPVPYGEEEFATPLKKLRRAEILLLGSLPLFYMFTSMGYDLFVSPMPDSQTQLAQKFSISLSLSGLLGLTDFILGEFQEKGKNLNARE